MNVAFNLLCCFFLSLSFSFSLSLSFCYCSPKERHLPEKLAQLPGRQCLTDSQSTCKCLFPH